MFSVIRDHLSHLVVENNDAVVRKLTAVFIGDNHVHNIILRNYDFLSRLLI